MKILVTGTSGHLGEALVRTLRAANHEVTGIDILPSDYTDNVGSIADRQFVKQCMRGINAVLHAAALHKPHVATHTMQDFVDTNITGTLNLLEEAALAGAGSFIFTSTTSVFGNALRPPAGSPAVWITEDVAPIPKNIYGVTKLAAEEICKLFHKKSGMPCLVLRTSRFFPEEDDQKNLRQAYDNANLKANEMLYRRADTADMVSAHLLAMEKALQIGFGRYIISATSPFTQEDLPRLNRDAPAIVKQKFPEFEEEYLRRSWKMLPAIDRVYVNDKARKELGWQPVFDFRHVLDSLKAGEDPRSPLAIAIGSKGYHEKEFEEGPYPVE